MSSAFSNLEIAVVARLDAALAIPVYDHVPQDTAAPFVVVSDDLSRAVDTKTSNGVEHVVEVNLYSAQRGFGELKILMDSIYSTLQQEVLSVTGVHARPLRFDFSEVFAEPDGSRGVMRFRTTTTPQ